MTQIELSGKRLRKKLKRMRIISGRLTAFGTKGLPESVLKGMRRKEGVLEVKKEELPEQEPIVLPKKKSSKTPVLSRLRSFFVKRR